MAGAVCQHLRRFPCVVRRDQPYHLSPEGQLQVTAITIAYVLPLALISPFVDHWNIKRVMISSDLIRTALILLLVFVTDVTQICLIFAVMSTVSSFFTPAQSVTIRTVVPQEGLLAANTMISQAFYLVRLLSPFAAGALIAWLHEKPCFYLDAASFIFLGRHDHFSFHSAGAFAF